LDAALGDRAGEGILKTFMSARADETSAWRARLQVCLVIGILAGFAVLTIASDRTVMPNTDDAGLANPGYNLAYHGYPGTTLYETAGFMPDSMKRLTYWHFPAYFYLTAGWFRVAGFGIFQVRILSTLFALLGLVSWYWIARRLAGSAEAGLVAMSLVGADFFYGFSASNGRMDMMCCGLGAAALASYLLLREQRLAQAVFVSHAFATMCIMTHPAGGLYYLCLLAVILTLDRRRMSLRIVACGAIPAVAGMALLGSYVFQDFAAFQDQMRATLKINADSFNDPDVSSIHVIRFLQLELRHRYLEPFGLAAGEGSLGRLKAIVLIAYITGMAGNLFLGVFRKRPGQALAGCMPVIAALYLGAVSPSKFSYYLAHVTAFFAAGLGVFICSLQFSPRARRVFVTTTVLLLVGLQVGGTLYQIRRDAYHRIYLPAIQAIRANTTPQSIIVGPAELWFALEHDRYIITDFNLGCLSGSVPDMVVIDKVYRSLHADARTTDPTRYACVEERLKNNHVIYANDYYQVETH
jgi:4-amino-4-deoxy-L-arabinose transferase-like glycosyltransferase